MVKKSVIGLSIFALLFVFPVISLTIPQIDNTLFPFEVPKASIDWDLGSYYNYTGAPIDVDPYRYTRVYINDTDPIYNWTYWSSYPWLTGSGTENNPYIIEKLLIDAQNDGACMYIYNSDEYFVIRQCYFANTGLEEYDIGVYCKYVANGEIYGNIIEYCKTGFYLSFDCYNISIYRNFMHGTKLDPGVMRAFYPSGQAHDCSFVQNVIFNYEQLAHVAGTANITIDGNFMNNTEYKEYPNPVISISGSENIKFRENIFTDNYKWFDFDVSQVDCANNTITGNTIISDLTVVEIPTPLSIGNPPGLYTTQSSSNIIALSSTSNSQVINNHIYQPSESIPGFEPFLLIIVIGATGVILVLISAHKRYSFK
jgi:hypothetical protein